MNDPHNDWKLHFERIYEIGLVSGLIPDPIQTKTIHAVFRFSLKWKVIITSVKNQQGNPEKVIVNESAKNGENRHH